ncbi:WAP four-disulfide core domain protein 2-like [Ambystoma mexicanum]|uniref:WAP four-disulfide core domain protein 2-like n=1 Tax=Ambystoma mexicanum TaxID=8296 RepID=UPI0037E92BCD
MLATLILPALLGLVLADGGGPDLGALPKRGYCPGEDDRFQCHESDIDKCKPCEADADCEGSLKCCHMPTANAPAFKCLFPLFRNPCKEDTDCPRGLSCCNGQCADVCSS